MEFSSAVILGKMAWQLVCGYASPVGKYVIDRPPPQTFSLLLKLGKEHLEKLDICPPKIEKERITDNSLRGDTLFDELKRNCDVLVDMNCHSKIAKGISVATFGLCGCIGGWIDNPDSNTFFHYDTMSILMIDRLTQQDVSSNTRRVHFFVPGQWGKSAEGRLEFQPKEEYIDRHLRKALDHIQAMGVKCVFHCYDLNQQADKRYQGSAWIDREGELYFEGLPVGKNSITSRQVAKAIHAVPKT